MLLGCFNDSMSGTPVRYFLNANGLFYIIILSIMSEVIINICSKRCNII